MAKDCKIENMTVDASVHGNVIEVENYDGSKSLIAAEYRQILPDQIFCSDCGDYLPLDGLHDVDKVVKQHMED